MSTFGSFGTQNQAGTGLFCGTNTPSGATGAGGGLFGNPQQNTTQPTTTGTSLFGNATPAANPFGSTTTGTGATGGGLFGNTSTNPSGGGLFGNTGAQQQQPAAGGLFGGTASQQPQTTSGGLFGATAPQPSSGGLFRNTNAQQQQQQQQQQQPASGSLFGNVSSTTTPQPTGGSLFGGATAQQPAGGSLFGGTTAQQPATGSLFGNTTGQQPSGGSLFGSTSTQQQPATGTSLFGNTATQQPTGGGLFGSTTTQQQQPSTGFFGSSTTQAPATGSLFSSTTGSNPLFGNKSPASIFGGQSVTPAATTTPSLFGQSTQTTQPSTSLFGQSQVKPVGSLFGSTTQTAATGSLFGSILAAPTATGSSLLGSRASPTSATAQHSDPQSQFVALTQRIDAIAEAWNPNSPQCRFQHYFYNLVDPSQVSMYGRPPNATNETLWQRAARENPDPTCLVPALALGFDAVHTRVEAQTQQAAAQQEKLKELKKRLEALKAVHNDNNSARIQRAASQHTQISHRLLKLIQHLHLLIPAVRSSAIRPEEEALGGVLEEIEEEIRRPGGTSKMRAKLNELWALVGAVNAARERVRKGGIDGPTEWTVVDEEGLKQIAQILVDQQAGLEHLTKILQRDLKDLRVIMGDGTEGEDLNSEKLYSSTSTLRASTLR